MENDVYLEYTVKSEYGTLDEVIGIKKSLVSSVKDCVDILKELYDDDLSDIMFEVFITVALIQGVEFIQKNKNQIKDLVVNNRWQ